MVTEQFPLSVVILTHNQTKILALQIASLKNQKGISSKDFEVIITDDSSSFDELLKAEEIARSSDLRCTLIHQDSDRFWAAGARNKAIRAANGKLLLFLDGDMIPETDILSKHLMLQDGQKNHIVAGHRLRRRGQFQDHDLIQTLELCRNSDVSDLTTMRWQRDEEKKREEFLRSSHPWRVVFSCHMSVNASPELIFDERFKGWGPEDWELAYRLTQHHGFTVGFAPEIHAYEVDHLGEGVSNVFRLKTKQAIIDYLRNTFYFFDKCPGLSIEEVFWGLQKLELRNGDWVITQKTEGNMQQRVNDARRWLSENGHYDRNS